VLFLRILRMGYPGFPTSKFLDLLEMKEVEKVTSVIFKDEKEAFDDLYKTAAFFGKKELVNKKFEFKLLEKNLIDKVIYRLDRKFDKDFFLNFVYKFKKIGRDYDFIWVGDNDFDGSNLIVKKLKKYMKLPIYRSYKETRFSYSKSEKNMLEKSDKLILPHELYINFFSELYDLDIKDKTVFADLDWRYSKTISWVKNLEVKKLSYFDNVPHVCILTGVAIWDPSEKRSGNRYYFIDTINDLIKIGAIVHLHTFKIVKNRESNLVDKNNPYEDLTKSGKLFIEKPLNLYAGSEDYYLLKRYDAGIMHPKIHDELKESNYPLYKFQQINIPNRFYEYQMADVVPIVEENSSYFIENLIKKINFGIVYSDLEKLKEKLWVVIGKSEGGSNNIKSFKDFSKVLVKDL